MDYFAKSPLVHIKTIAYSKADEHFLETLTQTIYNNLEDTELDAEKLARLVNMSRPTLFRKIKAISNLTFNELINISRLEKAAELLKEKNYKIYEIAMMVGYAHHRISAAILANSSACHPSNTKTPEKMLSLISILQRRMSRLPNPGEEYQPLRQKINNQKLRTTPLFRIINTSLMKKATGEAMSSFFNF